MGPSNWLVVSKKLDLIKFITTLFDDKNFAITDLSHSRTVIEIEGDLADEVIKKGCPLNINEPWKRRLCKFFISRNYNYNRFFIKWIQKKSDY